MTTKLGTMLTSGQEEGSECKRLSRHQHLVVFLWKKIFLVDTFHFI